MREIAEIKWTPVLARLPASHWRWICSWLPGGR